MSTRSLLAVLSILTVCGQAIATDKPDVAPDQRLSQKVTIESTDARLHTVLENLSKMTGVGINCGTNKRDWRVRDIPVVVCVKDMPLSELLKMIADSTHLLLSSETVGSNKSYRIWRDAKREKQLTEYEDKKREWQIAQAKWEWDIAGKIKDIPYSDIQPPEWNAWHKDFAKEPLTRESSRFIAALGNDALDKMLRGEKLVFSTTDAPESVKSIIPGLLRAGWNKNNDLLQPTNRQPEPSDSELAKCVVVVYNKADEWERPFLVVYFEGPLQLHGMDTSRLSQLAFSVKTGLLPEAPAEPSEPEVAPTEHDSEFMSVKIKTEAPKDKKRPTYGDVLAALSKAIGYSIVTENFQGHQSNVAGNIKSCFGPDVCIAGCLYMPQHEWKIDKKSKTILGMDRHWTLVHRSLVPESIITGLMDKLDGDGVEFDDILPLTELDRRQMQEWISSSEYLSRLFLHVRPCDRPMWEFYRGLSDADKALAKSEAGLPLGKFDLKWFEQVFAARNKELRPLGVTPSYHNDLPTDPAEIAELKLVILQYNEYTGSNGIKTHMTSMIIRGKEKTGSPALEDDFYFAGKGRTSKYEEWFISGPYIQFPVFSREREAELAKEAAGK